MAADYDPTHPRLSNMAGPSTSNRQLDIVHIPVLSTKIKVIESARNLRVTIDGQLSPSKRHCAPPVGIFPTSTTASSSLITDNCRCQNLAIDNEITSSMCCASCTGFLSAYVWRTSHMPGAPVVDYPSPV